ncbi:type II secretion system F family protein [Nocardioides daphniae]|uniref:Type II secretion system protein F n=1 Tax=Nocardioides daphniae TaxID=402297 RepID=A0A4P7UAS8_9ACTN|nr:type II secretion system F family protein [Nocardioides daphniae]QCC76701.1 type II secretion system protein F [Nocardioides daphniae]GGD15476.1 type II secretion system protein F [Nocardioides daphniae]
MGAVVGLGFGMGALLVWASFALPRPERTEGAPSRTAALLARAGMGNVSVSSVTGLSIALGAVAFLVVQVVSETFPVALVFGLIASSGPMAAVQRRARVRQQEFAQVWPEAVDNLASAVRAGLSLPDALISLSRSGPPPLRDAFAQFGIDYHVSGRFGESLDRLKERLADPVGDRMVEGLRVAREVGGGDLGRLLRNLSHYLREEARTRSELEARQAWTVNGARLAIRVQ